MVTIITSSPKICDDFSYDLLFDFFGCNQVSHAFCQKQPSEILNFAGVDPTEFSTFFGLTTWTLGYVGGENWIRVFEIWSHVFHPILLIVLGILSRCCLFFLLGAISFFLGVWNLEMFESSFCCWRICCRGFFGECHGLQHCKPPSRWADANL